MDGKTTSTELLPARRTGRGVSAGAYPPLTPDPMAEISATLGRLRGQNRRSADLAEVLRLRRLMASVAVVGDLRPVSAKQRGTGSRTSGRGPRQSARSRRIAVRNDPFHPRARVPRWNRRNRPADAPGEPVAPTTGSTSAAGPTSGSDPPGTPRTGRGSVPAVAEPRSSQACGRNSFAPFEVSISVRQGMISYCRSIGSKVLSPPKSTNCQPSMAERWPIIPESCATSSVWPATWGS